jgi:hypothetical protein
MWPKLEVCTVARRDWFAPDTLPTKTDFCGLIFEQRNGMFETLQLLLIGMLDTIFGGCGGTTMHNIIYLTKKTCSAKLIENTNKGSVRLNLSVRISQPFSSIFLLQ